MEQARAEALEETRRAEEQARLEAVKGWRVGFVT